MASRATEIIGWLSSFILVVTIWRQVYKQWRAGTSEGVSVWLYIGQLVAEIGFVIYAWSLKNWVFLVTNALLGVTCVLGLVLVLRHRRCEGAQDQRRAA